MHFAEINPASDLCQRWASHEHSWRHRSEGGFNPDAYTVEPVDESTAKNFVTANHYSGSYPAASLRYGLFTAGQLVGVMVLGIPVQTKALTSVFPTLEPFTQALELSRFVLHDGPPGNSESWFLARCFEEAAAVGIRGVVSFADPVPRNVAGRLLFPGHIGTIYQATNSVFCGRSTARTLNLLPNGEVLNARSMQKVRAQDRGHRHVEEKLIALGARAMRACENPAVWLAEAIDTIGVTRIRHNGCFRYAFAIGTRSQRRHVRIALAGQPYPKNVDRIAA